VINFNILNLFNNEKSGIAERFITRGYQINKAFQVVSTNSGELISLVK